MQDITLNININMKPLGFYIVNKVNKRKDEANYAGKTQGLSLNDDFQKS